MTKYKVMIKFRCQQYADRSGLRRRTTFSQPTLLQDGIVDPVGGLAIAEDAPSRCRVQRFAPAPEVLLVLVPVFGAGTPAVTRVRPPVLHFLPEVSYQLLDGMVVVVVVLVEEVVLRRRRILHFGGGAQRRVTGVEDGVFTGNFVTILNVGGKCGSHISVMKMVIVNMMVVVFVVAV